MMGCQRLLFGREGGILDVNEIKWVVHEMMMGYVSFVSPLA